MLPMRDPITSLAEKSEDKFTLPFFSATEGAEIGVSRSIDQGQLASNMHNGEARLTWARARVESSLTPSCCRLQPSINKPVKVVQAT
jgi:hypothetical protein